jgi:Fur family ferric uptake transcriptional regulator
MERKGLRSTAQRRLVTDVFFRSEGHLSLEDLLARARRRDPRVGYATIYRTMRLLKECGLAYERHFEDGVSRYEVAHSDEHHDHLICVRCHRIVEFEDEEIERLQEQLAERNGFALLRHKHELYGICSQCRREGVGAGIET